MITTMQPVPEAVVALMSTSASDLTFELVVDDTFAAHRIGLTRAQVEQIVANAADHGVLPPGVDVPML